MLVNQKIPEVRSTPGEMKSESHAASPYKGVLGKAHQLSDASRVDQNNFIQVGIRPIPFAKMCGALVFLPLPLLFS